VEYGEDGGDGEDREVKTRNGENNNFL